MKVKILLIICILILWNIVNLHAQIRYTAGDTIKGKNASYFCVLANKLMVKIFNTNNRDSSDIIYYNNGKLVGEEVSVYRSAYEMSDLYKVCKEVFTPAELDNLKRANRFILIDVVANSEGEATEIYFTIHREDTLLGNLDPDRLYLLEQKFKKILKLEATSQVRSIRNNKYIASIKFSEIP